MPDLATGAHLPSRTPCTRPPSRCAARLYTHRLLVLARHHAAWQRHRQVTKNTIKLGSGEELPYGVCVWSAGNAPRPLVKALAASIPEQVSPQQQGPCQQRQRQRCWSCRRFQGGGLCTSVSAAAASLAEVSPATGWPASPLHAGGVPAGRAAQQAGRGLVPAVGAPLQGLAAGASDLAAHMEWRCVATLLCGQQAPHTPPGRTALHVLPWPRACFADARPRPRPQRDRRRGCAGAGRRLAVCAGAAACHGAGGGPAGRVRCASGEPRLYAGHGRHGSGGVLRGPGAYNRLPQGCACESPCMRPHRACPRLACLPLCPRQPPPKKPVEKLTLVDRAHAALGRTIVEEPEIEEVRAVRHTWGQHAVLAGRTCGPGEHVARSLPCTTSGWCASSV